VKSILQRGKKTHRIDRRETSTLTRQLRRHDTDRRAAADAGRGDADIEPGLSDARDYTSPGFLVPPGRVIHLRHLTSSNGPPTAELRHPSRFTEIAISIRLLSDHAPKTYVNTQRCKSCES
jgi:hypothetical protein